jgi:hypothetical protein
MLSEVKGILSEIELKDLHDNWLEVAKQKATMLDRIFLQGRAPNESEQRTINLLAEKENEIFWKATGWKLKYGKS